MSLSAQLLFKAYMLSQSRSSISSLSRNITDPEKYGTEFAPKAQATIRNAGGKFVVIGGVAGVGAKPIHAMSGEPPKRMTIQAWESMDAHE